MEGKREAGRKEGEKKEGRKEGNLNEVVASIK